MATLTSSELAADVLKAGIFVKYIQKVAPAVGDITGLTGEITQALKDQATKMGGVSPFAAVFDLVRNFCLKICILVDLVGR